MHLFKELGSIEAAWFFRLDKLGPFLVDIDTEGNNYFDQFDNSVQARKEEALRQLGIEPDFQFTKLY